MQTSQGPRQPADSNPESSGCEATVLNGAPVRHSVNLLVKL